MKGKAGKSGQRLGGRIREFLRSASAARWMIAGVGVAVMVALFVIAIIPVR